MPYSVQEAISDSLGRTKFLRLLAEEHPDAWWDHSLPGWRSRTVVIENCDDFDVIHDAVVAFKHLGDGRVYSWQIQTSVPMAVFLMKVRESGLQKKLLELLRD